METILSTIISMLSGNLWALMLFLVLFGLGYILKGLLEKMFSSIAEKVDLMAQSLSSMAKDVGEIKTMVAVEQVKNEEKFKNIEEKITDNFDELDNRLEKIENTCARRHET